MNLARREMPFSSADLAALLGACAAQQQTPPRQLRQPPAASTTAATTAELTLIEAVKTIAASA